MIETKGWAILLSPRELLASGGLRLHAGIEVCPASQEGMFWLRGGELTEELESSLRKLALDGIFRIAPNNSLLRHGSRLPIGQLPLNGWQLLNQWLKPMAQVTAPLADLPAKVALRMERCGEERPPQILLTDLNDWAAYVHTAPAVRLSVLKMAVASDGRVIVRGSPLPPIRGKRCIEDCGIAVPCGWQIGPALDAVVLANLLDLHDGDLALFSVGGSYEKVEAQCFTRASRAAIAQTLAEQRP